MIREFTSTRSLFKYLFISLIIFAILIYRDNSPISYFVGSVVPTIMLLIIFRDYKIVIDNEKVEFFSLYREKKIFLWKEIKQMEIRRTTQETKLESFKKNIYIYSDSEKFTFNIHELQSEEFFEAMDEIADKHSISVKFDKR
ncbi:hypothetical protein R9X47_22760 [Wukongibacter baidiensis]|uniref:hypothetical protein n=1 Tax=Wukongibacter baidiensis TaxID=1723361 RepID=UPI003D7F379D